MRNTQIHLYEALPHPYAYVREGLTNDAEQIVAHSTEAAIDGTHALSSSLELELAGFTVAQRVVLHVSEFTDVPGRTPLGRVHLKWRPDDHQAMFPVIRAELEIQPVDGDHTFISLLGLYEPPLGLIGRALDRLVMHQLAEAALGGFFTELLERIRRRAADAAKPERVEVLRPD